MIRLIDSRTEGEGTGVEETVRFCHYSVKEYLMSDRITQLKGPASAFAIRVTEAHQLAASITVVYLLTAIQSESVTTDRFPFLGYAAQFWPNHVHSSTTKERPSLEYKARGIFDSRFISGWLKAYNLDRGYHYGLLATFPPPLYYSSLLGFGDIAEWLLNNGANVNAQGGYYGNALQAALAKGHEKVVQLLLDKGANVNAQGGDYGNALQAASANGHEKVVQLLLDKGANVDAQGGHYGNALQAALTRGHEKVVQLLQNYRPH